ncbi:unnamed protein product [Camellia sinensis]
MTDSSSYIESHRRLGDYMPLHINAIQGDIQSAMRIINNEPAAIWMPISTEGESMLITAVRSVRRNELVARLLDMLSAEDLADQRDNLGRTALHVAAEVGNLEAAKMLVDHNCDLLIIEDKEKQTPIIYATKTANMEMHVSYWIGPGPGPRPRRRPRKRPGRGPRPWPRPRPGPGPRSRPGPGPRPRPGPGPRSRPGPGPRPRPWPGPGPRPRPGPGPRPRPGPGPRPRPGPRPKD